MLNPDDELAIRALADRFDYTIDHADAEGWLALWTGDGVFRHPSGTFHGIGELTAFIHRRSARLPTHPVAAQRHWVADPVLRAVGDDRATAEWRLLVSGEDRTTGDPVVGTCGRFVDALLQTGEGWRLTERVVELDYVRAVVIARPSTATLF